jgi:predicted amidohydrolase
MAKKTAPTLPTTIGLLPRPSRNGGRPPKHPSKHVALALVQFAPRKGDVDANVALVGDALGAIKKDGGRFPDIVVFPETALSGYFVEGGVREVAMPAREALTRLNAAAASALGKKHAPFDIVAGFYEEHEGKLHNSALYATLGAKPAILHIHRKMFLPTYGVFDEERFVSRGRTIEAFDTTHGRAAILICEDACHSLAMTVAALRGAQIVYIPSASPGRGLHDGEPANVRMWREISRVAASEFGVFVAYAGLLGFEGGKGFTGSSRLVGPFGDLRAEAPFDTPAILRVDIGMEDVAAARAGLPMLGDLESNLAELVEMLDAELPDRAAKRRPTPSGKKRHR